MLGLKTKLEKWNVLERFKLAAQKFSEAWTACLLAMVGGDVTVISLGHITTAAKTGFGSAVALLFITLWTKIPNPVALAWLTGIIVTLVDFSMHANHAAIYGEGEWREAAVTGVGAALLGLVLSKTLYKGK